ncbi:MAG: cytidylate kinase-like family protein [Bacteroidales bacterium]|jgi:cytidylate kinase|nr:cytidylate kinase-like family protein [Bacteroidales bacterium]
MNNQLKNYLESGYNSLKHYLESRYHKQKESEEIVSKPIITISRQYGCPALALGHKLEDRLKWELISKEKIYESAELIKIDPKDFKSVYEGEEQGIFADLLNSFSSDFYSSDIKIKNALRDIITFYAKNGNAIIVGRAGAIITRNHPKSIHIKLEASLNWRIKTVMDSYNISEKEAADKIKKFDKARVKFRKFFNNGKDLTSYDFDITYNCERMNTDQIADSLVSIIESL